MLSRLYRMLIRLFLTLRGFVRISVLLRLLVGIRLASALQHRPFLISPEIGMGITAAEEVEEDVTSFRNSYLRARNSRHRSYRCNLQTRRPVSATRVPRSGNLEFSMTP